MRDGKDWKMLHRILVISGCSIVCKENRCYIHSKSIMLTHLAVSRSSPYLFTSTRLTKNPHPLVAPPAVSVQVPHSLCPYTSPKEASGPIHSLRDGRLRKKGQGPTFSSFPMRITPVFNPITMTFLFRA